MRAPAASAPPPQPQPRWRQPQPPPRQPQPPPRKPTPRKPPPWKPPPRKPPPQRAEASSGLSIRPAARTAAAIVRTRFMERSPVLRHRNRESKSATRQLDPAESPFLTAANGRPSAEGITRRRHARLRCGDHVLAPRGRTKAAPERAPAMHLTDEKGRARRPPCQCFPKLGRSLRRWRLQALGPNLGPGIRGRLAALLETGAPAATLPIAAVAVRGLAVEALGRGSSLGRVLGLLAADRDRRPPRVGQKGRQAVPARILLDLLPTGASRKARLLLA